MGRQLKQSVKVFQSLMLYLLLPETEGEMLIYDVHSFLKSDVHDYKSEALTLIIEAIYSIDGCTLMISPQQEEVLWIFNFVGQEETDGLQGLLPPVHVVAQKQVVALRREASIFEQPQQVVVLPVDVTCRVKARSVHAYRSN